ncbi:MAG: DUF305 domain-containing protein [Candidatus Levybacteria bacterium]|nr:DUF305 domain-containing protein [Candidatus Levybacteria bacterium]
MQKINVMLAISLMTVTFLIGSVAGYFISPTYQQTMFVKDDMDLGKADKFLDLRYINAMISHHRGAILLANQVVEKSHREEVRLLARDIQKGEPKLIAELYQLKKNWYDDGRKVSDPSIPNLGGTDDTFDLRFLNALIAHHDNGIIMTREIRSKSTRSEILDNADAVENFLSQSLIMLKSWRAEWFDINS